MKVAVVTEYFPGLRAVIHASTVPLLQVAGTRVFMHLATFMVMSTLARELGQAAFGVFAFAVLIGTNLSELLLGMGIDMAAVRLSAPHWQQNTEQAWLIFQLVGVGKLVLGLGVMLLGFVSADFI